MIISSTGSPWLIFSVKLIRSQRQKTGKGTGVSEKDKGLSVAAIILDLIMPVMDGFAFLEEFKNTANISIFRSSLRQRKTMWKMKNAVWSMGYGILYRSHSTGRSSGFVS